MTIPTISQMNKLTSLKARMMGQKETEKTPFSPSLKIFPLSSEDLR